MIARCEVWDADLGKTVGPVVVVTRESAIPVLRRLVCVAITKTLRGHPAEVELSRDHGLDELSAANCDWVITLPKERLVRRRGQLDAVTTRRVNAALVVALGLDQ
ncbi:MAG TPA: type II toxin-antitoxin system PemK/MazF family toxin [Solirubrobacteraceae bacterium]|nr:type II toxin-antitoxin system PemK/MazF family toxin [Solirubrobacteraceae bacterium]